MIQFEEYVSDGLVKNHQLEMFESNFGPRFSRFQLSPAHPSGSDGGTFKLQQVASRSAWLAAYALCPSLVPPLQGSTQWRSSAAVADARRPVQEKNEVICVETWRNEMDLHNIN